MVKDTTGQVSVSTDDSFAEADGAPPSSGPGTTHQAHEEACIIPLALYWCQYYIKMLSIVYHCFNACFAFYELFMILFVCHWHMLLTMLAIPGGSWLGGFRLSDLSNCKTDSVFLQKLSYLKPQVLTINFLLSFLLCSFTIWWHHLCLCRSLGSRTQLSRSLLSRSLLSGGSTIV